MALPARLSRRVLTIGMPPPTAASKKSGASCASDRVGQPEPVRGDHRLVGGHDRQPARQRGLDRLERHAVGSADQFDEDVDIGRGGHRRRVVEEARAAELGATVALVARAVGRDHARPARPRGQSVALPLQKLNEAASDHAEAGYAQAQRLCHHILAPLSGSEPCRLLCPSFRSRINEARRSFSPTARPRISSSSCAPCGRRSGRRARASSRTPASPALPAGAALRLRGRAPRAAAAPAGQLPRPALRAASATASSALRLARSTSRTARASRIALRLASRSSTAGSFGSYLDFSRNFSAIAFFALAAAAWRSEKLLPFRKDIGFRLIVGDARSCHSASKSAMFFAARQRCAPHSPSPRHRGGR